MADVILPPYNEDERMLSGLAYPLWPLVCPLVLWGGMRREEPFVHFHTLQALALGVVSIGSALVVSLVAFIFLWLLPSSFVTFSGFIGLVIFAVLAFALMFWLFFVIYVGYRASSGDFMRLPFIGKWAEEKMQLNLNITAADYATTIIGEKREVKIDSFDYEAALKQAAEGGDEFAKAEVDSMSYTLSNLEGDSDTIEYARKDSGDISDYFNEAEPAESKLPGEVKAASDGFKPSIVPPASRGREPGRVQIPTEETKKEPSDGFKPSIVPTASRGREPRRVQIPTEETKKESGEDFTPLSASLNLNKQPARGGVKFNSDFSAPSPVRQNAPAGNAPPRGQAPRQPAQPPKSAAAQTYQGHSYPPGSRPASRPAASMFSKNDYSQNAPSAPPAQSKPKPKPAGANQSFTPGIVNRPPAKSKRTFNWEELDGE